MDHPGDGESKQSGHQGMSYGRFAAMIVTAVVAMFALTYANTFALSHVHYSETRLYMALLMGGSMAIIMLAFMLGMYRSRRVNIAIFVGAALLMVLATWLVRSQAAVGQESYMRAMIPHHSIAILTSERSGIDDVRVCELAVGITEAQRREIAEMKWLLEDIDENGPATTHAEAEERPMPSFSGSASRDC